MILTRVLAYALAAALLLCALLAGLLWSKSMRLEVATAQVVERDARIELLQQAIAGIQNAADAAREAGREAKKAAAAADAAASARAKAVKAVAPTGDACVDATSKIKAYREGK